MTDDVGPARRAKGARAVPAKSHTLGGGRYREHRGKRGCKRSRRTSAAGQARQTRNARAGVKIGCRVQPAPSVDRRTAHRGRCALRRVGNVSALQIRHPSSNGRGVGDAAPYGVCVWVCFSGAVRWAGSLDVDPTHVTSYAATFVSLSPVRGGVLDAPRLRDCRGWLGAPVRRDRWHPCFPRCARLCPPPSTFNPAGTARAPL